jgi:hypothetical protein
LNDESEFLQQAIANAKLMMFPSAHAITTEAGSELCDTLLDFLKT